MRWGYVINRPGPVPRLLAGLAISAALHAALLACHCVGLSSATLPSFSAAGVLRVDLARPLADIPGRSLSKPAPAAPGSSEIPAARPEPAAADGRRQTPSDLALLPLPAALYLPARELTRRPQIVDAIDLDTPAFDAYSAPGKLSLRLFVNESGNVDAVAVDATDLPAAFAERARAEFSRARLKPGEKDGQKVKSQMRIEVSFDPR